MKPPHERLVRTLISTQFALLQYIDSPTRARAETLALCAHQVYTDHQDLAHQDAILPIENQGRPSTKVVRR